MFWLSVLHDSLQYKEKEENKQGSEVFCFLSQIYICIPNIGNLFIFLPLSLMDQRDFFHWAGSGRGREKETQHRGALADTPCYFPSTSHWLCQQRFSLSRTSELRDLTTSGSGREAGRNGFHCIFDLLTISLHFFHCPSFFPSFFFYIILFYWSRLKILESNPSSLQGSVVRQPCSPMSDIAFSERGLNKAQ